MSGQSADVYDLGGDINAFAPTNPQSQPPGTQGTPLTPVLPKSSLPKSPPSQAPGADQPQSAPQSQPAPQTAQPSTNSPDVYDLGEPQAQEPTQKTFPPSPDTSAMTNYVAKNLNTNIPNDGDLQHFSQAEGTIPGTPTQAKTFKEALEAGLQLGMIGTIATKNNPSYVVPQDADWTMDMVGKIGELAGSALEIAGGMAAGANIGAIGGGLTMGIPGAAVGAVVGAGAGAFGVPQAIRKMLVDHYEKGDIKDPADFAQRLMGTAWEGIKGSITGAATTLTGGAAGYAYGTMGQLMSELTTMTGVGQALEGQLPKWKDFRDNAIMLGGLHAIPHVVGKLHNMYANLGLKPDEVRQAAQNDIVLYQYLINRDWHVPEGAGPSELQHFSQADGTIPPERDVTPPSEGEKSKPPAVQWNLKPIEPDIGDGGEPQKLLPPSDKVGPFDEDLKKAKDYIGGLVGEETKPPAKSIGDQLSDDFNSLIANGFSREKALEYIYKKGGVDLTPTDAVQLLKKFSAAGDSVQAILLWGPRDFKTGKLVEGGEGLIPILEEYQKATGDTELKDLVNYGIAARVLEKASQGNPIHVDGKPVDLDQAMRVATSGQKTIGPYLDRIVKFMNQNLIYARDAGVYSPKAVDAMIKDNQAYMGLQRIQDYDPLTGKAPRGGSPIQELVGKGGKFKDPITTYMRNTEFVITKSLENQVKTRFVQDFGLLPKDLEQSKSLTVPGEKGLTLESMPMLPDENGVFKPLMRFADDHTGPLRDNQFDVLIDGERRVIEVAHKSAADAINSMASQPGTLNIFGKTLRLFANSLRLGTVDNPLFAATHIERNVRSALVFSNSGLKPWDMALALPDYLKQSDAFKDALYNRALVNSVIPKNKSFVDTEIRGLKGDKSLLSTVWNHVGNPFKWSNKVININDNTIRLAEYMRLLDQGASNEAAASGGRGVLPDYNTTGIKKNVLWLKAVAFAKIHYLSEIMTWDKIKEDPVGLGIKALAWIALPKLMLNYINRDDKQIQEQSSYMKENYDMMSVDHWRPLDMSLQSSRFLAQKMSDFDPSLVKQNTQGTFINDKSILRLAEPFTIGKVFGNLPTTLYQSIAEKNPRLMKEWTGDLVSSFVGNFLPEAIQAPLEGKLNHSFQTGKSLVTSFDEKQLPEFEYKPYTSESAKQLAKIVARLPLIGDSFLKNPINLDNLVKGWTGQLGQYAVQLADVALHKSGVGDTTPKAEMNLADIPFVKQFLARNASMSSNSIEEFRQNSQLTQQAIASYRLNPNERNYIASNYGDYLHSLSQYSQALSSQTKLIQYVNANKDYTPLDKKQIINGVMYQMMATAKRGNDELKAFQAQRGH